MGNLENDSFQFNEEIEKIVCSFDLLSHEAPELELETLPTHLKYVFLGSNNALPVIISYKLNPLEEKS